MKHRTYEQWLYPDGLEEVVEEHFTAIVPRNPNRVVVLEYYAEGPDVKEDQLKSIKRIEGNVTAKEVQKVINDYLDLYCNPVEDSNCGDEK